MKLPETPSVVDLGRIDTAAHTGAVDELTTAMGYNKQNVTNTEALLVILGGAAIQMRTEQSISATVEEGALQQFSISIMDVDTGSVASASIDITSISAVIEKSTGGGAFSAAGLDAIVFGKEDGRVFKDYTFNAAQWAVGDVYKIVVSGIQATVGGDTAYVAAMVWSNLIVEDADVKAALDALVIDVGDFSARAYDPSLLQVLGVPDVDGKDLTTLLVTDRLDNATHGLSALQVHIGDFTGKTYDKSILQTLGVPDVDGKDLYTCVVVDRLDDATIGLTKISTDVGTAITDIGTNQTDLDAILADVGDFSGRTNNLKSLMAVIGLPDADDDTLYKLVYSDMLAHGTYGLSAIKTLIDNQATAAKLEDAMQKLTTPAYDQDTDSQEAISEAVATMQGNVTDILADTGTAGVVLGTKVAAFKTLAGENQIAITTEDLNQAAAAYDLFTGTTKAVLLKSFSCKLPTGAAGGSITSIAIATDDATPGVLVNVSAGDLANLTSEAELSWNGVMRIEVGTKIQLTIAGGAHGSEYITNIVAEYVAIEDTGYLAV